MSDQRRAPRRFMPRRVAVLAAMALVGATIEGLAQPGAAPATTSPAVALAWSGPGPEEFCLGEERLVQAVNDYLGRQAFADGSVELVLEVSVEHVERRWRAVLELRDVTARPLGRRTLDSSGELCSSLDEPLTLAVALMVDEEPEPEPEPSPVPPEVAPEPETEPDPDPATPPAPSRRADALRVQADASLALELGLLPHARPGLAVGLEVTAASWLSARLTGLGFLPASVDLAPGATTRFALLAAMLELCPGLGERRGPRLALCVGPLYGALRAESSGLETARSTWRRLLAASLALRGTTPLTPSWSLAAGVAGVVPYRPDRFSYADGPVRRNFFQVSAFSLVAQAGASVMF